MNKLVKPEIGMYIIPRDNENEILKIIDVNMRPFNTVYLHLVDINPNKTAIDGRLLEYEMTVPLEVLNRLTKLIKQ